MTKPKNRIVLFLDGTWNESGDNTNVWRLKSLCSLTGDDGCAQVTYYDAGVNGFFGGTFGKGLSLNVIQAYEWLIGQYTPDDEIFIFGFSRGAYTARSLAGLIAKYGLLKPGSPLGVSQMYDRYRRANEKTIRKLLEEFKAGKNEDHTLEEKWMLNYAMAVDIEMVAIWDTVGALGMPVLNIKGVSRKTLNFLHTGLRIPIKNGFHAVSIDEHRGVFSPTLWTVRHGVRAKPRPLSSVEQRWFVGAHANVGGGYYSDLLAQRPLQWIMGKASKLGLSFRYDIETNEDVYESPINDSYKEFLRGTYAAVCNRSYRIIGDASLTDERGTHTSVNETIDSSVFERWRRNSSYRPPSLIEWSQCNEVDIEKLNDSVLANDPSVAVRD